MCTQITLDSIASYSPSIVTYTHHHVTLVLPEKIVMLVTHYGDKEVCAHFRKISVANQQNGYINGKWAKVESKGTERKNTKR